MSLICNETTEEFLFHHEGYQALPWQLLWGWSLCLLCIWVILSVSRHDTSMVILPHCSSFETFCCMFIISSFLAAVLLDSNQLLVLSHNLLFLIKWNIGNKFCICYHCSRDGRSQKFSSNTLISELSTASEMMASRMKGEVVIGCYSWSCLVENCLGTFILGTFIHGT